MLRGVGAGRVSSSCNSGPVRLARPALFQLRLRLCQDPTPAARAPSPTLRGGPGTQQDAPRGVAAGAFTSRWTRSSRRRISPWSPLRGYAHGTGVRRRVHNTPTLGAPGASHPDDRTTDQAGGAWGGWPPPDHRSHLVGPGRLDPGPEPGRRDRPSETRGDRLGRPVRIRAGRPAS